MTAPAPRLSILVVIFRIPRQADNTLYSLSIAHQRHVTEDDYEIIVVENASDQIYGEERARSHGENVRYFLRDEPGVSPVPAVNFGFEQARGKLVGLMIDGAHMVTPGVVEQVLLASRVHPSPIIAVPAHHLGQAEHHLNRTAGYDEKVEEELLARSGWKQDGYALFDMAVWSGANYSGYFSPAMESNCLVCTREAFEAIGRADTRFRTPGGGLVNQDIFARLCRLPGTRMVVLGGEGSFHQFHGGVSTTEIDHREEIIENLRLEHVAIHGHRVIGHDREPLFLGEISPQGMKFLNKSAELGHLRYAICRKDGKAEWPND